MSLNPTILYYQHNAEQFIADTQSVDMSPLYTRFLEGIPAGGHILDAGCGSGRDTKAFAQRGFVVSAFDASEALVKHAQALTGLAVETRTFSEVTESGVYDGIWACASLLHLPEAMVKDTLHRLCQALKSGGLFYLSFKYGSGEREYGSRHFTDATEERLHTWCDTIPQIKSIETWITEDRRPDRNEQWLNALIQRQS